MATLSQYNHFQFGYNGKPFVDREHSSDSFWIHYGTCSRPPVAFRNECLETARVIRQSTREPIFVLFSGGADSEVTLRSFVEAGISVTARIMRFKGDLNAHDISYAIETCRELEVQVSFFDLDLLSFWKEDYLPYAHITRCFSPQLITTMHLIDHTPGYVVLGSGECLLNREGNGWYLWEKERIASWYRFFLKRNRSGCPGFFQYTPELMLSYLLDPMVKELVGSPKDSSSEIKLQMYQSHFHLKDRPKFTGFEKVQDEDFRVREGLKKLYSDSDQIVKTKYHELVAHLGNRQPWQ